MQGTPVLVITGAALNDEVRAALHDLNAKIRFKPIGMADLLTETRSLLQPDAAAR
jgi:hypothetical protein